MVPYSSLDHINLPISAMVIDCRVLNIWWIWTLWKHEIWNLLYFICFFLFTQVHAHPFGIWLTCKWALDYLHCHMSITITGKPCVLAWIFSSPDVVFIFTTCFSWALFLDSLWKSFHQCTKPHHSDESSNSKEQFYLFFYILN